MRFCDSGLQPIQWADLSPANLADMDWHEIYTIFVIVPTFWNQCKFLLAWMTTVTWKGNVLLFGNYPKKTTAFWCFSNHSCVPLSRLRKTPQLPGWRDQLAITPGYPSPCPLECSKNIKLGVCLHSWTDPNNIYVYAPLLYITITYNYCISQYSIKSPYFGGSHMTLTGARHQPRILHQSL